uniref:Uncharacterized protein n=1 Tax=Opuntia streptacantha TaxID=393608 RepID=A0A7C9CFA8_OPUST
MGFRTLSAESLTVNISAVYQTRAHCASGAHYRPLWSFNQRYRFRGDHSQVGLKPQRSESETLSRRNDICLSSLHVSVFLFCDNPCFPHMNLDSVANVGLVCFI